jgi:hypothetical protein
MATITTRRLLLLLTLVAAPSAADPGQWSCLPAATRTALQEGKVVRLQSEVAGSAFSTAVAAIVPSDPADVLARIREYDELERVYPEMRDLSFDHGVNADRFQFRMKLHPLLQPIAFSKDLSWSFDSNGDAAVKIRLLGSSQRRVTAQDWSFELVRLDADSTLVLYTTRDTYDLGMGRQKLLAKLTDISERLVGDLQDRCLASTQLGSLIVPCPPRVVASLAPPAAH